MVPSTKPSSAAINAMRDQSRSPHQSPDRPVPSHSRSLNESRPRFSSSLRHATAPSKSPDGSFPGGADSKQDRSSHEDVPSPKARVKLENLESLHGFRQSTSRQRPQAEHGNLGEDESRTVSSSEKLSDSGTNETSRPPNTRRTSSELMSPSLKAAFTTPTPSDPPTGGSADSNKTIRGLEGVGPQPGAVSTPSYPFPHVFSPLSRSNSLQHQPSTTLSPTTPVSTGRQSEGSMSNVSSTGTRRPAQPSREDSRASMTMAPLEDPYPRPDLYDVILQLNSELDLDAWWEKLSRNLQDWCTVERASISLPADDSDLENVPWAQKASFDTAGLKDRLSRKKQRRPSAKSVKPFQLADDAMVNTPVELADAVSKKQSSKKPKRPVIESRHSYAGYEIGNQPSQGNLSKLSNPYFGKKETSGPRAMLYPYKDHDMSIQETLHSYSTSKPDSIDLAGSKASSVVEEDVSSNPSAMVFSTLRTLDSEKEALIDSTTINRVLERNGPITLTREYTQNQPVSSSTKVVPSQEPHHSKPLFHSVRREQEVCKYEEHEQMPASPWSQSPAPSPTIQGDPEENPFFIGTGHVEEESFKPAADEQDYSKYGQVEAIGVDKASTIIHVPLIHPLQSQEVTSKSSQCRGIAYDVHNHDGTGLTKKAPIAILSVLSRTVPFPQALHESLAFLGPHLATSLYTCIQIAGLQTSNSQISGRNTLFGRGNGVDNVSSPTSLPGSLASPSDYSPRSKHSPTTSNMGTPTPSSGGAGGQSQTHSAHTPGSVASEGGDCYFQSQGQSSQQKPSRTPSFQRPSTPSLGRRNSTFARGVRQRSHSSVSASVTPHVPGADSTEDDAKWHTTQGEDAFAHPNLNAGMANNENESGTKESVHLKRHTLLHSHGADFSATFQSLPSAAGLHHSRSVSLSDKLDMPPPSESLIRTIIDALPCQIFTAHPVTGNITWVNSKYLVYSGLKPPEILKSSWSTIHPDDATSYIETWKNSVSKVQQFQQKVRLKRFDQEYRWFFVRAVPLRDKKGNVVHWIGTYIDFHDQHIAEANAAKQHETAISEAKYRALANSSPQIVFSATREGGLTFCNNQWVEYSGQQTDQAMGVGFMDFVHPEDLIKCKLPSFDESDISSANVPISVPLRTGRRSQSGSADVSSEESDHSGPTLTGLSRPPEALPQRKLSELAGKGILRVSKDATGRPSYSTEVRLRTKDGEYRWHLVRVMLTDTLIQGDEKQEIWYGSCSDINDHKQLESQLKETMNAKSHFLSNMSHEIRTPLNGIHGMATFLMASNLTEQQLEHVNVILNSTQGLQSLINDILDFSKVEGGMMTLNMDWLHIRSLIEEVNDLTGSMAIEKGIDLNYIVEDDVPVMIKGDRFRMNQILLNTVGNAIKFTARGEVFVRCRIFEGDDPELLTEPHQDFGKDYIMIEITISDTGKGFTDKEKDRLFKRFSQIDGSSTRQHGGTGLGLAISKQLAELHGGTMTAHGNPGKGSSFSFSLKVGVSQPTVEPPTAPALQHGSGHGLASKFVKDTGLDSAPVSPRTVPPLFHSELKQSPASLPSSDLSSSPSEHMAKTSKTSSQTGASYQSSKLTSAMTSPSETDAVFDTAGAKEPVKVTGPAALYSVLVICPLDWALEATVKHLEFALPDQVPHHITSRNSVLEAQKLIGDGHVAIFTHIVTNVQNSDEVAALIHQVVQTPSLSATSIVLVSHLKQKGQIGSSGPLFDFDQLVESKRIRMIYKPLKPSKLAPIFDPKRSREMSTDVHQLTARQIAEREKKFLDDAAKRIGHRNVRILTVEDNFVLVGYLKRISVTQVEKAMDGVEGVQMVKSKPPGYYSLILCDLHMPRKDGYQTCRDIREWESANGYPRSPIIALSANVLGDVIQECVRARFNYYLSKPVEFNELSHNITDILDKLDSGEPIDLLR